MKGNAKIYHRPYCPPIFSEKANLPFICRLAPDKNGFAFEWFDKGCDGAHKLFYGKRGETEKVSIEISESTVSVDGLITDTDYEFYIENRLGERSITRLFHTGAVPEGTSVINYLHPEDPAYIFSGKFLCSPSIARTDTGRLIATMDVFGGMMAQNLMIAFYSDDDGESWKYLTDLFPFYWGSLFYHKGTLYLMGLTTEYGNLQISCSKDNGETWANPVTLFYGSNVLCDFGGMHRAPMHMTSYKGRLYTSCEYGCWKMGYHLPAVLSIDENADLMNPENWTRSDFLKFEGEWREASGKQGDTIEGNLVCAPDGDLYSIIRWKVGSFLKLKANTEDLDKAPDFVSIVEAPVSNSMFRLFKHSDRYILITNRKTDISGRQEVLSYRSVLSLFETKDLENFTLIKDIVNFEYEDATKIGFQYPAFAVNGNDLYVTIRSAFNNAENYHNSNYILFTKIKL